MISVFSIQINWNSFECRNGIISLRNDKGLNPTQPKDLRTSTDQKHLNISTDALIILFILRNSIYDYNSYKFVVDLMHINMKLFLNSHDKGTKQFSETCHQKNLLHSLCLIYMCIFFTYSKHCLKSERTRGNISFWCWLVFDIIQFSNRFFRNCPGTISLKEYLFRYFFACSLQQKWMNIEFITTNYFSQI